jgi:hypothetical protein
VQELAPVPVQSFAPQHDLPGPTDELKVVFGWQTPPQQTCVPAQADGPLLAQLVATHVRVVVSQSVRPAAL